jgi:hypothetical protein
MLAFTTPPTNVLSLPQQITRWIVLQKARCHPLIIDDELRLSLTLDALIFPVTGIIDHFTQNLGAMVYERWLRNGQSSRKNVQYSRECESIKGLGSSAFARHYLRNHWLFSLPQGTKMFQFPCLPLSNPIYSDRRH